LGLIRGGFEPRGRLVGRKTWGHQPPARWRWKRGLRKILNTVREAFHTKIGEKGKFSGPDQTSDWGECSRAVRFPQEGKRGRSEVFKLGSGKATFWNGGEV